MYNYIYIYIQTFTDGQGEKSDFSCRGIEAATFQAKISSPVLKHTHPLP